MILYKLLAASMAPEQNAPTSWISQNTSLEGIYRIYVKADRLLIAGSIKALNLSDAYFAKYLIADNKITPEVERRIYYTTDITYNSDSGIDIVLDDSNNLYLVGAYGPQVGLSAQETQIRKYNSSGSQLYLKGLLGNPNAWRAVNSRVDSSGNMISVGSNSYNSIDRTILIKLDSNGNIVYRKNTGFWNYPQSMDMNSSGDVYITGYSAGFTTSYIGKVLSSGAGSWAKSISFADFGYGSRVKVDSSNNIYHLSGGREVAGDPDYAILIKLDPNGNVLWQKSISCAINNISIDDTSGDIYLGGKNGSAAYIAKLSSSGSLIWQTEFNINATCNLAVGADDLYVTIGNRIAKLSKDGNDTGTYASSDGTSIVYSTSSATVTNGTKTISANSMGPSDDTIVDINSGNATTAVFDISSYYAIS